jgi:phosphatidylglycerophosphatase A
VLAVVPDDPAWQLAAFFVFRAFDVVKPPPIREFERRVKGGLGVMLDDVLAAGYTLVVLAIAKRALL